MTIWRNLDEILAYLEYAVTATQRQTGELLAYVEYLGNPAGSYMPDIATLGEVLGYAEYIYEADWQRRNVAEILGYAEVLDAIPDVRNLAEILVYVEYLGDQTGNYTSDIATLGEVLGYLEYEYTRPAPLALIYGPLIWTI